MLCFLTLFFIFTLLLSILFILETLFSCCSFSHFLHAFIYHFFVSQIFFFNFVFLLSSSPFTLLLYPVYCFPILVHYPSSLFWISFYASCWLLILLHSYFLWFSYSCLLVFLSSCLLLPSFLPTCLPAHPRCKVSGRCIPKAWVCDTDKDCGPGDDSDEHTSCSESELLFVYLCFIPKLSRI